MLFPSVWKESGFEPSFINFIMELKENTFSSTSATPRADLPQILDCQKNSIPPPCIPGSINKSRNREHCQVCYYKDSDADFSI